MCLVWTYISWSNIYYMFFFSLNRHYSIWVWLKKYWNLQRRTLLMVPRDRLLYYSMRTGFTVWMKIILGRVVNCATSRHGCFIYYCGARHGLDREKERETEKDKTESQQRENKRHQTEIDIRNWVATRTSIRCVIYIYII